MKKLLILCIFIVSSINFSSAFIFSDDDIKTMKKNLHAKSFLQENIYIIGHRGSGSYRKLDKDNINKNYENTLESFKDAVILGADGIEFDVFATKDGHIVVIHDDDLKKNVFDIDKNDKDSRISKKNLSDILKLFVGSKKQKIPTFEDIIKFTNKINYIRKKNNINPLILNIDVRDLNVAIKCFQLLKKEIENKSTTIDIKDIYFTSSDYNVLVNLKKYTNNKSNNNVNIVPQANTKQIFGENNVYDNFLIKNPRVYDKRYLKKLQKLIDRNKFIGIDCVVGDVNDNILQECISKKLQLHAYISSIERIKNFDKLSSFIYYAAKNIQIYIKSDDIKKTVDFLMVYRHDNRSTRALEKNRFVKNLPLKNLILSN